MKRWVSSGFSIVEILVVAAVIGILVMLAIVGYGGFQASARDTSVLKDIDTMEALQTDYGVNNNTGGKPYDSEIDGFDEELGFSPAEENIIKVFSDSTDYCIVGYNPKANKNSLENSFSRESSDGVCEDLMSS